MLFHMLPGALVDLEYLHMVFLIGNALAKSGEAVKSAPEQSAVPFPDEQLSTSEMELRMKLLRENR